MDPHESCSAGSCDEADDVGEMLVLVGHEPRAQAVLLDLSGSGSWASWEGILEDISCISAFKHE